MGTTTKEIAANLTKMTNAQLWDMARKMSPKFEQHTAHTTYEKFKTNGIDSIDYTRGQLINEWMGVILMPVLQKIDIATVKNPLEDAGFTESYETPNGGVIQRMATGSIKPISPRYHGLKTGDSVDPWTVRKPDLNERFFVQNFDYQSLITIQEFQHKQILASDFGAAELIAGFMQGLANGYTLQRYVNELEAINGVINSNKHPLRDNQKITIAGYQMANPTDANLMAFIKAVKDIATNIKISPEVDYNAAGFKSRQEPERLKLLVRAGYMNDVQLRLELGAFNPDRLTLPFDLVEVPNFGGLEAYADAEFATKLYPAYNALGEQIGFNTKESNGTPTDSPEYENDAVYWKDPNENVIAVLMDKGTIFTSVQNPYQVIPAPFNPAGLYQNYWASSPNNGIHGDYYYTTIVFQTDGQPAEA